MTSNLAPWNVLLDPQGTFSALEQKPRWLFSLSLLVLSNLAIWIYYYQVVDFDWLQTFLVSSNPDIRTGNERAQALHFLQRGNLVRMACLGVLIGIPLMCLISATYYSLVGKLMGVDERFPAWYGFVVSTAFPGILSVPVMLGAVLMSDGRIAPEQMNLLSINSLFFDGNAEAPFKGLMDALNLTTLWSVALAGYGLRQWSGRSWWLCLFVALLPMAMMYGAWLAASMA